MALTRQTIISRARTRLATEDSTLFTSSRLYQAFNDSQRRWAEDTKCLSSEDTHDLTINVTDYDLSDLAPLGFEIRRVRVRPSSSGGQFRDLDFVPLDDLPENKELTRSLPTLFSTRGETTLVLYPTPAATITDGLALDTFNYPADLAENSTDDAQDLEFSESHREGLTLSMIVTMCEMGMDDDTLAARLPYFLPLYVAEKERRQRRSAYPTDQVLSWSGSRPSRGSWKTRKIMGGDGSLLGGPV